MPQMCFGRTSLAGLNDIIHQIKLFQHTYLSNLCYEHYHFILLSCFTICRFFLLHFIDVFMLLKDFVSLP